MGQTIYRQDQPQTLADLLAQAQGQPDQGYAAAPSGSTPNYLSGGGSTLSDPEVRALYERLMTPESQGPAPEVEKKSTLAQIFKGIGDAASTYASIMGRVPLETHGFQKYMDSIEASRRAHQDWEEKQAKAKDRAGREGAMFLLGQKEKEALAKSTAADRAALQKDALAQREAAATQASQDRAAQRDLQVTLQQMRDKADKYSVDTQAAIHKLKDTNENDKDQHEEYKKVRMWAVSQRDAVVAKVRSGEMTTDDVRRQLSDMLDASDLTGKYRQAAEAFLDAQIGTQLASHDFATKYENQGPPVNPTLSQDVIQQIVAPKRAPQRPFAGGGGGY